MQQWKTLRQGFPLYLLPSLPLHLSLGGVPLTCCSAGPQAAPLSPIHGPNQWPTQLPTFDTALREYINNMLQLGEHLMRGQLLQSHSVFTDQVLLFHMIMHAAPVHSSPTAATTGCCAGCHVCYPYVWSVFRVPGVL